MLRRAEAAGGQIHDTRTSARAAARQGLALSSPHSSNRLLPAPRHVVGALHAHLAPACVAVACVLCSSTHSLEHGVLCVHGSR